jgi:hypothetical protein
MKQLLKRYFAIAFLIFLASCQSNQPIDAFQILSDYRTDESKANNTYLDQKLTVDVPVRIMLPTFDGGFMIVVNDNKGQNQLEFYIPKANIDQFQSIKTNTIIKIKGTCVDAGSQRNIVFKDCSLVM